MEIKEVNTIYKTETSLQELIDIQRCILLLDHKGWFDQKKLAERCVKLKSEIELAIMQRR